MLLYRLNTLFVCGKLVYPLLLQGECCCLMLHLDREF
uniref:Uncharacterized protein n=1 Tax=Rhizophora mucronata TaxID=61149 RepID=A0A2P2P6P8_RHIMU